MQKSACARTLQYHDSCSLHYLQHCTLYPAYCCVPLVCRAGCAADDGRWTPTRALWMIVWALEYRRGGRFQQPRQSTTRGPMWFLLSKVRRRSRCESERRRELEVNSREISAGTASRGRYMMSASCFPSEAQRGAVSSSLVPRYTNKQTEIRT